MGSIEFLPNIGTCAKAKCSVLNSLDQRILCCVYAESPLSRKLQTLPMTHHFYIKPNCRVFMIRLASEQFQYPGIGYFLYVYDMLIQLSSFQFQVVAKYGIGQGEEKLIQGTVYSSADTSKNTITVRVSALRGIQLHF